MDRPVEARTVCEAFQRIVAVRPDGVALRSADDAFRLTWAQLAARVERLTAGMVGLGLGRGDTLAILMPNIAECHLLDYATLHAGGVPFTIYNSSSPQQIRHQLENADARIIVTQQAFLPRVLEAVQGLGDQIEHLIVMDGDESTMALADVEAAADPGFDFEASWRSVGPEDLATIVYTSGTTGPPKGAQVSHRAIMAQLRALHAAVPLGAESLLSFLPMAHTGGRVGVHYMALVHGATITACPDISQVAALVREVRPDAFFSTPRLWEKLQVAIEAMLARTTDSDRKAAPVLADLGLDNLISAFVGGAPCPPEVVQFFRAVGIPLLEAYGSTEACLCIFNRIDDFKTGTAGRPLPGVEIRLLDDGELLVRSDMTMSGYRKQPEETALAIDSDGWLHTGDIASVDDDGFVTIIDRKKEIIINSAGKNMSPANIESAIKGETSLIGQIVTIGDGRRYNTALVTLDPEAAVIHAQRLGLEARTVAEISREPDIHKEIDAAVERGNARLSNVERVKKYRLLPVTWLPDSDELTPTMKIKRKPILAKYAEEIEQLYAD